MTSVAPDSVVPALPYPQRPSDELEQLGAIRLLAAPIAFG
jgi:hypothetical protein